MSTFDTLLGLAANNRLVLTLELQPRGGATPIPPPAGGGGGTPPDGGGGGGGGTTPPSTTYDTKVPSLLLSGYNNRLSAIGVPDEVKLAPFGIAPVFIAEDGFTRGNCAFLWEGAVEAPEDGEFTFTLQYKSGGYIFFNNDLKWELDREADPGSHTSVGFSFKAVLKKGELYPLKAELLEQSGEHFLIASWTRPSGRTEPIPATLCSPPADWQKRLKDFTPPPPPPSNIPTQPDWSKYQSPTLPTGTKLFPPSYAWYQDVSQAPVDPNSEAVIAGLNKATLHPEFGRGMNGLPINLLDSSVKASPVKFDIPDESDAGPYLIPDNPALENGGGPEGDYHYLGVDLVNRKLYEIYQLRRDPAGNWLGYAGVIWDCSQVPSRPSGYTSADASGGPITQGLVRFEEVYRDNLVNHALRVTVPVGRWRHGYVAPANHMVTGGPAADLIPMGARFRLKATADLSGLSPAAWTIAKAMQTYGLFAVDGTGSNQMFFTGVPDSRWDDDVLAQLRRFTADDLELVLMGPVTTTN